VGRPVKATVSTRVNKTASFATELMFISGMDLSRTYIAHHELESDFAIKIYAGMDAYVMARRLGTSINHWDEEEHRACGVADLMRTRICKMTAII